MGPEPAGKVKQLLQQIEAVLDDPEAEAQTLGLLIELARCARQHSSPWLFAHRCLASRLVKQEPWRASLLARRVLDVEPNDADAWGVLGLAQSLLGNPQYAVRAYRRALKLTPNNPWFAHNLGHLYDAILDQSAVGLPLLERAWLALPENPEIIASYAHALARMGEACRARELMRPLVRRGGNASHHALYDWIAECDEAAFREGEAQTTWPQRQIRRRRTTV